MVSVPTPEMRYGVPTTNGPAWLATEKAVIVSGLPSASLALFKRSPAAPSATVSVTSSVTVLVSFPSTGASLALVTETVKLSVWLRPFWSVT